VRCRVVVVVVCATDCAHVVGRDPRSKCRQCVLFALFGLQTECDVHVLDSGCVEQRHGKCKCVVIDGSSDAHTAHRCADCTAPVSSSLVALRSCVVENCSPYAVACDMRRSGRTRSRSSSLLRLHGATDGAWRPMISHVASMCVCVCIAQSSRSAAPAFPDTPHANIVKHATPHVDKHRARMTKMHENQYTPQPLHNVGVEIPLKQRQAGLTYLPARVLDVTKGRHARARVMSSVGVVEELIPFRQVCHGRCFVGTIVVMLSIDRALLADCRAEGRERQSQPSVPVGRAAQDERAAHERVQEALSAAQRGDDVPVQARLCQGKVLVPPRRRAVQPQLQMQMPCCQTNKL
jgi:hypothetical protein